jgi:hypothetical protein
LWRERAKHIDILKHSANEVIQNGKMLLATASQLADISIHITQWKACVVKGILWKTAISTKRAVKRVWIAKALKSSHVGPEDGCVDVTLEGKARARHQPES